MGTTPATGLFHPTVDSGDLVILIHGLGSDPTAGYVVAAAKYLVSAGFSVLRFSFRGANGEAPDFYNSVLTRDLHAAMGSPAFARYNRRFIVGFSLGGHLALRFATETAHPSVYGVAAVCPPLDLAGCQVALDAPRINLYRDHCLEGLRRTVRGADARARALGRDLGVSVETLSKIRTIRAWDDEIIAPRFGYADADDYYAQASVGPRLENLRRPALVVASKYDPMVPVETLSPYLNAPLLTDRITDIGGHVGFPGGLDLGFGSKRGLIPQIMAWLTALEKPEVTSQSSSEFSYAGYGRSVRPE